MVDSHQAMPMLTVSGTLNLADTKNGRSATHSRSLSIGVAAPT